MVMTRATLSREDPVETVGQEARTLVQAGDATADAESLASLAQVMRAVAARVLARSTGDPDVDDVLQDALRRVVESGEFQRRDPASLRPWALGVVRHVALDHLRGNRRRDRQTTLIDDGHREQLAAQTPDPFELVSGRNEIELAAAVLADLPDEMRRALVLFHVDGLGYKAIAQRMNVPLGTVATWVTRGRKLLSIGMIERVGALSSPHETTPNNGGSDGR
jgi:RNA polymerase sigma-70 factor (ECF subfamily)